MKTISLDNVSGASVNGATKHGCILLTRGGKPVAYLLPTRFYDEEDIGYMTDPEFWKFIRRRREEGGKAIPLEEVKVELEAREAKERAAGTREAKSRSKNGRKGKSNAAA
jgi:hypothetical protein